MSHSPLVRQEYFTEIERVQLGLPSNDEVVIFVQRRRQAELASGNIQASSWGSDYAIANAYCSCTFCTAGGTGWNGTECAISASIPAAELEDD